MIGTYAAALAICTASLSIGQAALSLCGVRRWSWLSPALGLALLCAICWATVRMPGDGAVPAILVPLLALGSVVHLRSRLRGGGEAFRIGAPVAIGALLAASLPFAVEGHFGILGTGFNPDMSQHLLATDRLADGQEGELLRQGYPLGPHAIVVALGDGLGVGLVPGFTGLTIAVATLAPLTALTAFADQPRLRAVAAALVVGVPYLVASYFAQGAFKETIQALLVLAFVLTLRESTRIEWRHLPLRYVPAAIVAIGTVYAYSFPGLIWLIGIGAAWAALGWVFRRPFAGGAGVGVSSARAESAEGKAQSRQAQDPSARSRSQRQEDAPTPATGPAATRSVLLAVAVLAIGTLPELGRMIDFKQFETFDPSGPGLGNLFGQVSPFTALGIWPSGDFRLAPGDGAVPAFVYYLGVAFATVLLLVGLVRAWRTRERAIIAGAAAVAFVYVAVRVVGTPYTAAKALEIAAPVLTLAIVVPLAAGTPAVWRLGRNNSDRGATRLVVLAFLAAAGACSLLAFANAPVGPASYSPALTGLRPLLGTDPTLVLASEQLLGEEHGERYLVWELRGGRVCIEPEGTRSGPPPPGIRFVIGEGSFTQPPFDRLALTRRAGPYAVWERRGVLGGPSPCPLIAVRQARQGP